MKSGSASIDVDDFRELTEDATVYLHQYEEPTVALPEEMVWISPSTIRDHIVSSPGYLPSHTLFNLHLAIENE
ncbi:hypothetical protein [Halosimplex sp. J119]